MSLQVLYALRVEYEWNIRNVILNGYNYILIKQIMLDGFFCHLHAIHVHCIYEIEI